MAEKKKSDVNLDWGFRICKVGLILFAITLVCTALLAYTNSITSPIIAKQNEEANVEAQKEVLPEADKFEQVEDLESKLSSDPTLRSLRKPTAPTRATSW